MTPLTKAMLVLGLGVMAWSAPLIAVRATDGGRTTADEPQYLLTALSLGEDRSLDIRDERAAERHRVFHEAGLPLQENLQPDGSRVSPHDPLLPAVLAVPMVVGGWVAAKLTLAAVAGVLAAAMLWVAVRRFGVPLSSRGARGGGVLAGCAAGRLRDAGLSRAAGRARGDGGHRRPRRATRPPRRRAARRGGPRAALAGGEVPPGRRSRSSRSARSGSGPATGAPSQHWASGSVPAPSSTSSRTRRGTADGPRTRPATTSSPASSAPSASIPTTGDGRTA